MTYQPDQQHDTNIQEVRVISFSALKRIKAAKKPAIVKFFRNPGAQHPVQSD